MLWAILILSVFFVFYVYVGYPLLLFVLKRKVPFSFPSKSYEGDISIVMVVFNEEKNIETKLNNLLNLNWNSGHVQIYVVDDGSTDGTLDVIRSFGDHVTLIQSSGQAGKANGLNLAMECVQTELVLMVDCRQELEEDVLVHLSSWFADDSKMGAVSGELMFKSDGSNAFSHGMDGYWKYEKFIRSSESVIASVPGVTGALYMLRTCTFKPIPTDTLLDDVQIPMVSASQGYKVGYDERAIAWDVPSTSVSNEKRRKIRTLSGNYQLLMRFPQWILPKGHPIWWQFFSHKIARLLAPFIAIFSFIVSIILSIQGDALAMLYAILFALGMAILPLGYSFPALNRISYVKLISSFITLNWFCVLAFFHYFSGIKSGAWKSE